VLPSGASGGIGCNLIGNGAVGLMSAGETPTEAAAVSDVMGFLGVPYVWGGESSQGFDCSGLVQAVYREAGVSLPRVAQSQYDAGPAVSPGQAVVPGDLVFFGTGPGDVSHVGMYVGDGLMVDAPHTGADVRFDRVDGFGSIVGITAPGSSAITS
jgi:cell wall-associated NlpC family hydrolase